MCKEQIAEPGALYQIELNILEDVVLEFFLDTTRISRQRHAYTRLTLNIDRHMLIGTSFWSFYAKILGNHSTLYTFGQFSLSFSF